MAIDRKTILAKLLVGEGDLASAPFMYTPGPYLFNDPSWTVPDYSPQRAKALLAEAGYPNGFDIRFMIHNAGFPEQPDVAEAIAGFWGEVGIKVTRQVLEFTPTFRDIMGTRSTAGMAWVLSINFQDEPLRGLTNNFSKGSAGAVYLHDVKIEEFIKVAGAEADDAKRFALARTLGSYLVEQRIAIPLFSVNGIWASTQKVKSWDYIAGRAFLNNVETIVIS